MTVELREATGGKLILEGHPSVFNVWYEVGSFEEKVSPQSFKRTLSENPDVVLLEDHAGIALARTRTPSGKPSLRLSETEHGLHCEADLDGTVPRVQNLRYAMENAGLQMSFAFRCTADDWSEVEGRSRRDIKGVNLHHGDVTVCNFGANGATDSTISARNGPLTVAERRQLAEQLKGRYERRMAPVVGVRELRASGYAAHELAELGAKGQAFGNPDGHWSFPTKTQADWEDAKEAVGRSGTSHNKVRAYLIGRAREMGLTHLIPPDWSPSGALRSSLYLPNRLVAAEQELELLRARR